MKPTGDALRASDYEMRPVTRPVALNLVERFHYSHGGANTGVYFHGLFMRGFEPCLGVAWWMPPTRPAALSVSKDWRVVLALTRLAIHPEIPQNAASFLLGRSIRAIRQEGKWRHLLTYADTGEGHTGAIYKATNWTFEKTVRGHDRWVDETGRMVAIKATVNRTNAEMEALGYQRTGKHDKLKFVMHL